jgi:hypothetical protein
LLIDQGLTGTAGSDIFAFGGDEGLDTVGGFDRSGDRFDLSGLFTALTVGDFDGDGVDDSRLEHDGGVVIVLASSGLTLDDWNGLVI